MEYCFAFQTSKVLALYNYKALNNSELSLVKVGLSQIHLNELGMIFAFSQFIYWKWISQTLNKPGDRYYTTNHNQNQKGERKRGQSRNTWLCDLEADGKETEHNWKQ